MGAVCARALGEGGAWAWCATRDARVAAMLWKCCMASDAVAVIGYGQVLTGYGQGVTSYGKGSTDLRPVPAAEFGRLRHVL